MKLRLLFFLRAERSSTLGRLQIRRTFGMSAEALASGSVFPFNASEGVAAELSVDKAFSISTAISSKRSSVARARSLSEGAVQRACPEKATIASSVASTSLVHALDCAALGAKITAPSRG